LDRRHANRGAGPARYRVQVERAATQRDAIAALLAAAGCIAASEEADELMAAADDADDLRRRVARRAAGEPLAWITGSVTFAGRRIRVDPGVYVPRWQSETLAERAIERLPANGLAADLCTGSGAIAVALAHARPGARIVATDIDANACACARANGVVVFRGDLAAPLPAPLKGRYDVVVAVVPYVPTEELVFLPRDVREHEPRHAIDGGRAGTDVLARAVWLASELLRDGGSLLLELGGVQDRLLAPTLAAAGYGPPRRVEDPDGDLRGIEAMWRERPRPAPG
jgi:release factor glutamine methyltransferase